VRRIANAALLALLSISPAASQQGNPVNYVNITGQATTTVKSTRGVLHTITFNNPVATSVVTIFDNTTNSGNKIGTITVPASPQPITLTYDVSFWIALTVVTATASSDITITYR
jgi:hypothetical protein